jgi:hypothetical protein
VTNTQQRVTHGPINGQDFWKGDSKDTVVVKLYWRADPVPCGKLDADQRGRNVIQFMDNMNLMEEGAVFIDDLKVTVARGRSSGTDHE